MEKVKRNKWGKDGERERNDWIKMEKVKGNKWRKDVEREKECVRKGWRGRK